MCIRDRGYPGEVSLIRAYIRPKRPLRASRATVRFETGPGQQLQHDWGELLTEIGGLEQKVFIAVNTLGYSRRFRHLMPLSFAYVRVSNNSPHILHRTLPDLLFGTRNALLQDEQLIITLSATPCPGRFSLAVSNFDNSSF